MSLIRSSASRWCRATWESYLHSSILFSSNLLLQASSHLVPFLFQALFLYFMQVSSLHFSSFLNYKTCLLYFIIWKSALFSLCIIYAWILSFTSLYLIKNIVYAIVYQNLSFCAKIMSNEFSIDLWRSLGSIVSVAKHCLSNTFHITYWHAQIISRKVMCSDWIQCYYTAQFWQKRQQWLANPVLSCTC